MKVQIYVDGGYHPKYKQAAYAYIQVDGEDYQEFCGFSKAKNSREAELLAAQLALENTDSYNIELYTDYQGLIDGIKAKKNTKEFRGIAEAMGNKNVKMFHMQGHREDNPVIRCDKIINGLWKELKKNTK